MMTLAMLLRVVSTPQWPDPWWSKHRQYHRWVIIRKPRRECHEAGHYLAIVLPNSRLANHQKRGFLKKFNTTSNIIDFQCFSHKVQALRFCILYLRYLTSHYYPQIESLANRLKAFRCLSACSWITHSCSCVIFSVM